MILVMFHTLLKPDALWSTQRSTTTTGFIIVLVNTGKYRGTMPVPRSSQYLLIITDKYRKLPKVAKDCLIITENYHLQAANISWSRMLYYIGSSHIFSEITPSCVGCISQRSHKEPLVLLTECPSHRSLNQQYQSSEAITILTKSKINNTY